MGSWTERRRHILKQEQVSEPPGGPVQEQASLAPHELCWASACLNGGLLLPSFSTPVLDSLCSLVFLTHCSGALMSMVSGLEAF